MAGEYSEDRLIEQTSLHILSEMLYWQTVIACVREYFGPIVCRVAIAAKKVSLPRYLHK